MTSGEGPFRSGATERAPLVFGATQACAACALRFAPRRVCPSCGSGALVSLVTREGRESYAYRRRRAAGGSVLGGLAAWAPRRPWLSFAVGVLLALPALIAWWDGGRSAFEATWLTDDLELVHDGLSRTGFGLLGFAALGAALVVLTVAASLAARRGASAAGAAPGSALRVHAGPTTEHESVTGIARTSTVVLTSPVGKVPCLAFGLAGDTPEGALADADGGDFDVELPSGERVMVSLAHAVLRVGEARGPGPETRTVVVDDELEELLEGRGLRVPQGRELALAESVLCEGDLVTVCGFTSGASIAAPGGRRARVAAGDEDRPLVVAIAAVGRPSGA